MSNGTQHSAAPRFAPTEKRLEELKVGDLFYVTRAVDPQPGDTEYPVGNLKALKLEVGRQHLYVVTEAHSWKEEYRNKTRWRFTCLPVAGNMVDEDQAEKFCVDIVYDPYSMLGPWRRRLKEGEMPDRGFSVRADVVVVGRMKKTVWHIDKLGMTVLDGGIKAKKP